MMPAAQSLITELDATLSNISDARHLVILQRVTDLFLVGAGNYSDKQVAIFDDVISHLIEDIDEPALIELSARLASVGKAPMTVVARLSGSDDIAISGPALEKSDALTDNTLAEIAGAKSQKHLGSDCRPRRDQRDRHGRPGRPRQFRGCAQGDRQPRRPSLRTRFRKTDQPGQKRQGSRRGDCNPNGYAVRA
jgi:hypothetical protein